MTTAQRAHTTRDGDRPEVVGTISSAYYFEPHRRLYVRGWFVSGDRADRIDLYLDGRLVGQAPLRLRRREAAAVTGRHDRAPGWCFVHEGSLPRPDVVIEAALMDGPVELARERFELRPELCGASPLELLEYEVERYEPPAEGMVHDHIDGFMRAHPYFERWRGYVETHLERFNRTFSTLAALAMAPMLPTEGGDVIDLAGAPYLLPLLHAHFPSREIVCMGADMHRSAYPEGRTVPVGDLDHEDVPWPDESAALVTFFEVIEHLHLDPMRALSEINRLLVPGGLVLLTTPNIVSTLAISKVLRGQSPNLWRQYVPFGGRRHVNEFAPDDLRSLMEAAGFEVKIWSENCYIDDLDGVFEHVLDDWGCPEVPRGDTLFALGRKVGPVRERYPAPMYDPAHVRAGLRRA